MSAYRDEKGRFVSYENAMSEPPPESKDDFWTPEERKRFVAFVAVHQMFPYLGPTELRQHAEWLLVSQFWEDDE